MTSGDIAPCQTYTLWLLLQCLAWKDSLRAAPWLWDNCSACKEDKMHCHEGVSMTEENPVKYMQGCGPMISTKFLSRLLAVCVHSCQSDQVLSYLFHTPSKNHWLASHDCATVETTILPRSGTV